MVVFEAITEQKKAQSNVLQWGIYEYITCTCRPRQRLYYRIAQQLRIFFYTDLHVNMYSEEVIESKLCYYTKGRRQANIRLLF